MASRSLRLIGFVGLSLLVLALISLRSAGATTGFSFNTSLASPPEMIARQPADLTLVHQSCIPIQGYTESPLQMHFLVDNSQELGTATTQPYDPCQQFTTAHLHTTQIPAGRHWIVMKDDLGTMFGQASVLVLSPVAHGGTLENLYRFLLNRPPDPSGAAYFRGKPSTYVAAVIESSTERHRLVVNELVYPRYLHRDADPGGSSYFTALLDRGLGERQLAGVILASPEYVKRNTSAGLWPYLTVAVYLDALNRLAAQPERDYWDNQIDSAGAGPAVHALVYSDEASERIVDAAYGLYLQRQPGPSERAYWVGAMHAGLTVEGFTVNVVGSPEFAARWS